MLCKHVNVTATNILFYRYKSTQSIQFRVDNFRLNSIQSLFKPINIRNANVTSCHCFLNSEVAGGNLVLQDLFHQFGWVSSPKIDLGAIEQLFFA